MKDYDKYIVTFSGGKDSTALLLFLLDNGIDKNKIEFQLLIVSVFSLS